MCSVWKTASLNFSQKISHEYLKLEGDKTEKKKMSCHDLMEKYLQWKMTSKLNKFDDN